jgi:DNA-binding transcriptional LysR family regulator
MNNFSRLDLNLLVTLDTLLAERNVTRAAERLNLSQPSVSVQLAKLREAFGDPLLVPAQRGMRPTARADELREPLREALESLGRAVAPTRPFDPTEATTTWRVAAADYAESAILLPALAGLRAAAPHTRLAVVEAVPSRMARQLEQAEVDLFFHTSVGAQPGLHRRVLFHERYVLAGREGHPRLKRRPSLAQFCALEHVVVSPGGGGFAGPTDEALAEKGLTRRVALSVPHFLFMVSVLARTDMVAMLPERLARGAAGLRVLEAPLEVPGYEMAMLWHERRHRDPAHRWLREQIAAGL